jgi:2-polyprenyl-3-methyl-5-hydroxy-6-metoxy-1,4-benzoquinol methylase
MYNETFKSRPCFICGWGCRIIMTGLFDDRFGAPGTYDIMQCQHCGLEQTWPRPSQSELNELYELFYNWVGDRTNYASIRQWFLDSTLYRLWLTWDGDISFHLRRGTGRLLDVGCNEGRGLAFYASNGFQAEGLEINERAAAIARERGFQVHTMPLEKFNPGKPYGVVVLSNVLEHALDPLAMLTQVRRLLSPQGQVWISCPNAASYWRQVFGRSWLNWHVPYHLWHFSPQTLREILIRANFHLVEMRTCTPALWLAQSLCLKFGTKEGQKNKFVRSPLLVAALMLAARGFLLLSSGAFDRRMAGDCLIAMAYS